MQDYCKSNQLISLKLGDMIEPTSRKKCLTFGGDPVPSRIQIPRRFLTSLTIAELGILHCVPKKTCDHVFDDKLK